MFCQPKNDQGAKEFSSHLLPTKGEDSLLSGSYMLKREKLPEQKLWQKNGQCKEH